MDIHLKNKLINHIKEITFPSTNILYEKDAVDGYAFLAYALAYFDLDYEKAQEEVFKRFGTISSSRKHYKTIVPASDLRTYQSFPTFEFLNFIENDKIEQIHSNLDKIGTYSNGMMRYCGTEINLIVPNVTALAAYMYAILGNEQKTLLLLNALRENYHSTAKNWQYFDTLNDIRIRFEDSYHVGMMLYAFKKIEEKGFKCSDLIDKAFSIIKKDNNFEIKETKSSHGFNAPFILASVGMLDPALSNQALHIVENKTIYDSSFRTKTLALWSLINYYKNKEKIL